MLRLVWLATLLVVAAWLARDSAWLRRAASPVVSRPAHAVYLEQLERSGLSDTSLGRAWISQATAALASPAAVTLPHQQTLTIDESAPVALALRAPIKRGQRIEALATLDGPQPGQVFVDVFEPSGTVAPIDDGKSRPTPTGTYTHEAGALYGADEEVGEDREVVVRVQPELLRGGRLHVRLRAAPALRFPVEDARPADVHSVFGDPRDAGERRHEGIDIFADRGTPVMAASDGIVTRVANGGLGGRVVWVWDFDRGLMFYYAHLDEQHVTMGERVRAGEVIGAVGNTGNARTTPPHLHFGIYERGSGAIDPYWFVVAP